MSFRFTTPAEASDFLLRYSPEKFSGQTYTLSRMIELMMRLGDPQNTIPAVHIAGTSGKTSTSYYIRALLEARGARVGLTTSPHISSITERVQIDGGPLADNLFVAYLNEFLDKVDQWPDIRPTYFELLTALAYWTFAKEKVDYMVIEVGLGGLLDATNVITSSNKVNVITPIGLDHTEILGNTLELIAEQKAGIITPNSVVFMSTQTKSVADVIVNAATRHGSHVEVVATPTVERSVVPLFQQANFALGGRVADYISQRDGLPEIDAELYDSVIEQTPPGRFEVYRIGGKTLILDGAHNPQKLEALIVSLRRRYDEPVAWLIGFISAPDDKIDNCLKVIIANKDEYITTQFSVGQDIKRRHSVNARNLQQKVMALAGRAACVPDATEALAALLETKQRTVVVTGSLYLVAQLRERVRELTEVK